ncbi:saccharopine dehydrogenase NADP-binding domain-containing protein [Subtercola endophyticus]|uniref:saccharopine dehydrogenase NADP-binding domain-containing protein n=1 Tax=Subtercola endophyticus TaxID=2895559 RepID=UPI001E2B51CF|nr:saccharopine dehydrogenase NADP-binding domain-containing protein [Subtercola endophyticus]UFS57464.1 saccharopine dehydrogenase NADP-binding domain-containing protein [Subtercola endophyticus]
MVTNKAEAGEPTRRPVSALITVLGATGAVGRPLAAELASRASTNGWRLRFVGRNLSTLRTLAERFDAEWWRVSELSLHELEPALSGSSVVVNLVGPFAATAQVVSGAALAEGCHYIDAANEYAAVAAVLARDAEARDRAVTLMPAVGFGTVATEGLAASVAEHLRGGGGADVARGGSAANPLRTGRRSGAATTLGGDSWYGGVEGGASGGGSSGNRSDSGSGSGSGSGGEHVTRVNVAMFPQSAARSRGAATSVVGVLADGGAAVENGRLTRFALGHRAHRLVGPNGPTTLIPAATGDLAAIPATLGARFVTSSVGLPLPRFGAAAALPLVSAAMRSRLLRRLVDARAADTAPKTGELVSYSWARVAGESGDTREAWLRAGEGYAFTVHALVSALEQLLAPRTPAGTTTGTPAGTTVGTTAGALTATAAFGSGFLRGLPGVSTHSSLADALAHGAAADDADAPADAGADADADADAPA